MLLGSGAVVASAPLCSSLKLWLGALSSCAQVKGRPPQQGSLVT